VVAKLSPWRCDESKPKPLATKIPADAHAFDEPARGAAERQVRDDGQLQEAHERIA
jgi:hypothetical protein